MDFASNSSIRAILSYKLFLSGNCILSCVLPQKHFSFPEARKFVVFGKRDNQVLAADVTIILNGLQDILASVLEIINISSLDLASLATLILTTMSSRGITSLPSSCPQRLGSI